MTQRDQTLARPRHSPAPPVPVWHMPQLLPQPALAAALPISRLAQHLLHPEPAPDEAPASAPAPPPSSGIGWNWNRLGWFDGAMALVLTYGVIRFWSYIMEIM